MASDYYEHKSTKGLLSIQRNKKNPVYWDFYLDGVLIRSDYIDPAEAAFDASKGDFGDEALDRLFNKICVPSDIAFWRTFKGKYSNETENVQNN
jgi:hypothetical protein